MNWILHISIWAVLAIAVVALVIWRKTVSDSEDDVIHVQEAEAGMLAQQAAVAQKLEVIDRWGKIFTALAILYGVFLGGLYVYTGWVQSSTTVVR